MTVGEAFTNNDATNNVTRIMDGNTDAQVVVGTSSNPKSYLIIDLGENHRAVTEIKMTNITNGAVLGLTNTIATDAGSTITLDYSIRGNAGKMYQSGDLGITYQTATSSLNSAKSDTTLTGDFKAIGTATLPEGYEYNSTTGEIQVKNNQEATPEIAIDYANEKLTGFVADGSYTIGGSPVTPIETVQMATAVVTIGPIVLLYPFLQKYFVQGLTVGSVKG